MRHLILLLPVIFMAACASPPQTGSVYDPYEQTNRQVHAFNKGLDTVVFGGGEDGADSGSFLHPDVSGAIINFADNAGGPGMVLNGLLQGDIPSAWTNGFRFVLNSTVGLFGFLDPADAIGLPEVETDFAHTMTIWGVQEGAYLELPFLGPSTERDLLGRVVDSVIDPLDRFGFPVQVDYGTVARLAGQGLKRNQYGDTIDSVLYDSADSYTQTRLIYLQNRRFELGIVDVDAVDPYDDLYGDQ